MQELMPLGAEIIEQSEVCANTDHYRHRQFQTFDCSIISALGETAGYYKYQFMNWYFMINWYI